MQPDPILAAAWDARLAHDGLAPLDQAQSSDDRRHGRVRMADSCLLSPAEAARGADRSQYYDLARDFLGELTDPDDRAIWELHAEGLSAVDVRRRLALAVTSRAVQRRIVSLRASMRRWLATRNA